MKEKLIRPIVSAALMIPEDFIGIVCGLNCTLIVIKHGTALTVKDQQNVTTALHEALDPAYVTLGLIRFI